MADLVLLGLVAVTSAAAWWLGTRRLGWVSRGLGAAAWGMVECAGLAVAFFAANLATGIVAVLAARAVSGRFVSLYLADDLGLLALSVLQALVFAGWRAASRH